MPPQKKTHIIPYHSPIFRLFVAHSPKCNKHDKVQWHLGISRHIIFLSENFGTPIPSTGESSFFPLHFQSHIFSWILSPDPMIGGPVILSRLLAHRISPQNWPVSISSIYIYNYPCSEGSSHMFSPKKFLPQNRNAAAKKTPWNRLPRRCPRHGGLPFFPKQGFAGGMPGIDGQGDRRRNRLEEILGKTTVRWHWEGIWWRYDWDLKSTRYVYKYTYIHTHIYIYIICIVMYIYIYILDSWIGGIYQQEGITR